MAQDMQLDSITGHKKIEKRRPWDEETYSKGRQKVWFVVGGLLLLLMSITSVGSVLASDILTDEEIYWLTYMREEEKLARDVYIYLFDMYGSRIFDNISVSEQKHMDAIKTLLDKVWHLDDPAAGNEEGDLPPNGFLGDLYKILTDAGKVVLWLMRSRWVCS